MAAVEVGDAPATPAPPSLRDRWRTVRNRILSNPDFQRWAAAFPLTRPVARRRARALHDLAAGFVYAQVLHACVRADLFEALRDGPRDLTDLAARAALPRAGAHRLLRAAAALELIEPAGPDRWALGVRGAELLGAAGVAEMVAHHDALYADLADPLALLRRGGGGGRVSAWWPYAEGATGDARPYSALMAASQALVADQALAAWPFQRHRRIMDVGGGDGTFLRAVAARHPDLALTLVDLPPVAEIARRRFAEASVTATVVAADAFRDPLPSGADLITLVRVLHDHDDAPVLALLRACRAALPPDGTLLIVEPMSDAGPVGDAYFGMYLLAMGSGRPRHPDEIAAMLSAAGFTRIRRRSTPMPMMAGAIVATP